MAAESMEPEHSGISAKRRAIDWIAASLYLGACALLALSLGGGFWLDEILASISAWQPPDWSEWLRHVHAENPHYLSILWMRVCGPDSSEWCLRLPSFLFAVATLLLVYRSMATEWGPAGRVIALLVWGLSLPFVAYAGEARGYSGVMFHSYAALLLDRRLAANTAGMRHAVVQGLNLTAGLLCHPVFLIGVVASGLFACGRVIRGRSPWRLALLAFVPPVLLVLAVAATLGGTGVSYGPQSTVLGTFSSFCGYAITGPTVHASVGVLLVTALVVWSFRSGSPMVRGLALRNLMWLVGIPASLLLRGSVVVYERYYLLALPVLLWMASALAAHAWAQRRGRILTGAMLAAYAVGQIIGMVPFLTDLRGDYETAVRDIVVGSETSPVTIGSDHDFRNSVVLQYYWHTRGIEKQLEYVQSQSLGKHPPTWFLVHDLEWIPKPHPEQIGIYQSTYTLDRRYSKGAFSGWHWFVYRRDQ